jgi:hypothetical protein
MSRSHAIFTIAPPIWGERPKRGLDSIGRHHPSIREETANACGDSSLTSRALRGVTAGHAQTRSRRHELLLRAAGKGGQLPAAWRRHAQQPSQGCLGDSDNTRHLAKARPTLADRRIVRVRFGTVSGRQTRRTPVPRSANLYGPAVRCKMEFREGERESCINVFGL